MQLCVGIVFFFVAAALQLFSQFANQIKLCLMFGRRRSKCVSRSVISMRPVAREQTKQTRHDANEARFQKVPVNAHISTK